MSDYVAYAVTGDDPAASIELLRDPADCPLPPESTSAQRMRITGT